MSEEVPKSPRKRRSKKEDTFEAMFGLAYGLVAGMMDAEIQMQVLGKPHDKDKCMAGKYCATHGEQKLKEE